MVPSRGRVAGLVLCRVAEHRFAFPAEQVIFVRSWTDHDREAPQARTAYELPAARGRVLAGDDGRAVVVDSLEVFQENVPLLAVPRLVSEQVARYVAGFVEVEKALWPVLELKAFSLYLSGMAERGEAV
jgi:hypothetical protein